MRYVITDIASVIGGEDSYIGSPMAGVEHLLIDSRSLSEPSTSLFFAFKTRNDDGHHYIPSLYNRGVRSFVVERLDTLMKNAMPDANFLLCESSLEALQSLARHHRRRFDIPVIAITGSRGKTTLKEWLNTLLSDDYTIVRSPRSFNSQIGVPLSLWEIGPSTTLAIIEAGISTVGEMNSLQDMIRPTIGIITNIGSEHNDGFRSMEQKANEKAKILTNCESVVYPADDPLVTHTIAPLHEAQVADEMTWSREPGKATITLLDVTKTENGSEITYSYHDHTATFTLPVTGQTAVENAMDALSVMLLLGIPTEVIGERMGRLTAVGTRLNVVEGVNGCTLVLDGYTSDYNSLTPALDFTLRRRGAHQPVTVLLSDLQNDGMMPDELYIRVSEMLKSKGVTRLIGVGPEMCRYGRYFTDLDVRFFASTTELLNGISPGDFVRELVLVKGAPEYEFDQFAEMMELSRHEAVEEIDLNALANNFKFFHSRLKPTTQTVAMVKARGYGTGSYEVAKTLQDCGVSYLAVAVLDEGLDLRRGGITKPIIVLNPSGANYKALFVNRLEPEIYNLEECRALIREGERQGVRDFPVHIKVDTGMHRLGFTLDQLPALIKVLTHQQVLRVSSVFSHLCVADEPEQDAYTLEQFECFDRCAELLQASFSHYIKRHILNTVGTLRFTDRQMDMVRLGIGLYGIKTVDSEEEERLQPVATLYSVIISIKDWKAGTTIGYGRRGLLDHDARVATVAMGYGDGMDRHFGNGNIKVWAGGKHCPTVGNICMDACMIDITGTDCKVGDRVEIFGPNAPIERLSEARGTIPYEILTSISPRVKRIYFRD